MSILPPRIISSDWKIANLSAELGISYRTRRVIHPCELRNDLRNGSIAEPFALDMIAVIPYPLGRIRRNLKAVLPTCMRNTENG
jgi:hypothetical protein